MRKTPSSRLLYKVTTSFSLALLLALMLASSTLAEVRTDKFDYSPGETITFYGAGYLPGETVVVQVGAPEKSTVSCQSVAAVDGTWSCQAVLPADLLQRKNISYTALGQTSQIQEASTLLTAVPQKMTFETSGLPAGISLTISGTRINPGGNEKEFAVTFTSPGPSEQVLAEPGTPFHYSGFPPSVTIGQSVYQLEYTSPPSGFTTGTEEGLTRILASYVITCSQPSVTAHPQNMSVVYGASAAFSASGSGNPAPTIQWQARQPGGSTWEDIGGAASTTLSFARPRVSQSGSQYRAVFSNSCGSSSTEPGALTVAPREISVSAAAQSKVYDGSTNAAVTLTHTGLAGDDLAARFAQASFSDKNAGANKTVTVSGITITGGDANNYTLLSSTAAATASITPRPLAGVFTVSDKIYDGSTSAIINRRSLSGILGADSVSLNGGTANFDSKNAGRSKAVTGTGFSLAGADAGNYTLSPATLTTTASITPKVITASITAGGKVYDGTTAAAITARSLSGVIGGDAVSLAGSTANFSDKNVGEGKTVTGTGFSLAGSDAGNYQLANSTLTAAASITPRVVTGSFTAVEKVYNGNTSASISSLSLKGLVAGDSVSLEGGSAFFDNKNVGNNKTVFGAGFNLFGSDADNYRLASSTLTATASITPRIITGNFAAFDKVYDGSTTATITRPYLTGVVKDDVVTLVAGTVTFDSKNAGRSKLVTGVGFSLAGADAVNYVLASTKLVTTADITPKIITGSFTAADKVYNGNTLTTITGRSLSDIIGNDVVSLSGGIATFDSKYVGENKTVVGIGFHLSGANAGNYALSSNSLSTTASITPRIVNGSFTAANKVYDGTRSAFITGRYLEGVIRREDVKLTGGTATFDSERVGTGKTVTGEGFSLEGAEASSYVLASTTLMTNANISYAPSGGFCYGGASRQVLPPLLNESGFPKGSIVPVKFRVCDRNGNSIGDPGVVTSFKLYRITFKAKNTYLGAPAYYPTQVPGRAAPDSIFRWDPEEQLWVFSIDTTRLNSSYIYYYRIILNDGGAPIEFSFGLQ